MNPPKIVWSLAGVLALCTGLCIWDQWQPLSDFANYYFGSLFLLEGRSVQEIYEPYVFNQLIAGAGYEGLFANYTPVSPFTLAIYIPFTWLEASAAKLVFNLLGSLLFAVSLARLFKHYAIRPVYLLLIPLLFFVPIRNNIAFGQTYFFVFALISEGFIALQQQRTIRIALFWALASLLKVFPFIIGFHLLLTRQWKALCYFGGMTIALTALSMMVVPPSLWIDYLTEILPRMQQGEVHNSFAWVFQSFALLLKNLLIHDSLLNPEAAFHQPQLFYLLVAFYVALILSAIVMLYQVKGGHELSKFAILIIGGLLISGYGNTYGLLLMLFPLVSYLRDHYFLNKYGILIVALIGLICNVPAHWLGEWPLLLRFPRLYLTWALFLFLLVHFRWQWSWKQASWLLPTFFVLKFFTSQPKPSDPSEYYLTEEHALLNFSYEQQDDQLLLKHWTTHAVDTTRIPLNGDQLTATPLLEIVDHQIYYDGKALTKGHDLKLQPMLLNQDRVLYLSDQNRGVGFYTLRTLPLNP